MAVSARRFEGARVLVTGGTGGIGSSITDAFVAEGATVTVTGTRPRRDDYPDLRPDVDYLPLTLHSAESVAALVAAVDRLDVLVNNAGVNLPGGRDEYEPDTFDEVVAANLGGPYRLTHGLHDALVAGSHDHGRSVVWITSLATEFGIPFVPAYSAAKAGVGGVLRTLAVAWGSEGIRLNAVAPGVVDTSMTELMMGSEALLSPTLDRTPLGRVAVPDDVAPAVLFLASDDARHITGQTLFIDGGFSVTG